MNSRNKANGVGKIDCQVALLRDKFVFYQYMKGFGAPVPEVFALMSDGRYYDQNCNPIDEAELKDKKDFFVKDIEGECASFVKHIASWKEIGQYKERLSKGRYILQRRVKQSKEMDAIYPGSLNTYRIVTINKDGNPYVLSSLLRVGTSKSGSVDNWAAGGLAIGIDPKTGCLKKFGFYKPCFGGKADHHPDTNVEFAKVKAPRFQEALEVALRAASCFYGIRAIGWDIAISEDGPVIIEGNDNWEISLLQAADRPLREDWMKAIE